VGIYRLLLAIAVVFTHSSPILGIKMVGGLNAVQCFYIISGFYMSMVLNEKYTGRDTYKLFITNRLLRLYPIYWAVLGIVIVTSFIAFKSFHGYYAGLLDPYYKYFIRGNMSWWTWGVLTFSNFALIGQDWLMFTGYHQTDGILMLSHNYKLFDPSINKFLMIPQAWTLGVEITFYLIAPFIVRRPLKSVSWLLGATIILRILSYKFDLNYDPWSYRFFPLELMYFLLGNVAYRLYQKTRLMAIPRWVYTVIFTVVIMGTLLYQEAPVSWYYPLKYTYTALLVLAIPFLFEYTKNNKIDRWVGELSYPLYICHMLFVSAWTVKLFPDLGGHGVTVTAYSLILAIILNHAIAEPIEKIRQKRAASIKSEPI